MSAARRSWRGDDEGVSEVVGYLMSFAIAVMILVVTVAAFGIIQQQGAQLAATAEFSDIANRVSVSILQSFDVGSAVRESQGSINSSASTPLVVARHLDVPPEFRGYEYTIAATPRYVYVNSTDGSIKVNSTTFKADIVLAPSEAACTLTYSVCTVSGTINPGASVVSVVYRYDRSASPLINRITIQ